MIKTDDITQVGKHAFQVSGLGLAPFKFVGMNENVIRHGDGSTQPGGSCDFCGTGIRYEFLIESADHKVSKVGCDCIQKTGDKGFIHAFKTSAVFRQFKRQKAAEKAAAVYKELHELIMAMTPQLATQLHPRGFRNFRTDKPLTKLDDVQWLFRNSGAAGRARLLKSLKTI
jgi:hypothetical protein